MQRKFRWHILTLKSQPKMHLTAYIHVVEKKCSYRRCIVTNNITDEFNLIRKLHVHIHDVLNFVVEGCAPMVFCLKVFCWDAYHWRQQLLLVLWQWALYHG